MSGSDWIEKYFSVQVFFIIFRETVETVIIVSVLLAFLNRGFGSKALEENHVIDSSGRPLQTIPNDESTDSNDDYDESRPLTATTTDTIAQSNSTAANSTAPTVYQTNAEIDQNSRAVYRRLFIQVWVGAILGLVLCLFIGSFFVFAFYYLGRDLWGATEKVWEATFSIIASLIITFMGAAMLRLNKMREKWRVKIAKAIIETHGGRGSWGLRHLSRKYALGILPFVTTLREGLEAVVFLGGLGANQPTTSFPLPVISAVALGSILGWAMYRSGNNMSIQYFLVGSTCFLYLVAAGLFSRGVWFFELQQFINKVGGGDVSESGSGPGSYDISKSVWHVNCCNPETDGGWMIFNALLGWQNSATYGSVISYNVYWWFVALYFHGLNKREETGYWPYFPKKWQKNILKYKFSSEEEEYEIMSRATQIYTLQNQEGREPDIESARNVNNNASSSDGNNYVDSANPPAGTPTTKRDSGESLTSNTPLIS